MMGVPSGRGYGIAIIVFVLLLVVGFFVVWYGVGATIKRRLHRVGTDVATTIGLIVGLAAAIAWVRILVAIDGATATVYALVFFGVPVTAVATARLSRSTANSAR